MNLTSNRITQVLLLALIATQVPAAYNLLTKYPSQAAALRACNAWADKGGRITYQSYSRRRSMQIRKCVEEDNQIATYTTIGATDGDHFDTAKNRSASNKAFRF